MKRVRSILLAGMLESEADLRAVQSGTEGNQAALFEFRADLIADRYAETHEIFTEKPLLFSLKSETYGGQFVGDIGDRIERLLPIIEYFDLIELEAETDLIPELLDHIPPEKRLISWQGSVKNAEELRIRFEKYLGTPAKYYKMLVEPKQESDTFFSLELLHIAGRSDLISYALGAMGAWTQLLAPQFGMPLVYGSLNKQNSVSGKFTLVKLVTDYGFPGVWPATMIYGIAGNPVHHSLSPLMHNTTYRKLGMLALYLPFHIDSFPDFYSGIMNSSAFADLGLTLRGLTMVSPYKEDGYKICLKVRNSFCRLSQGTNLMTCENGEWTAGSSDPDGVLIALESRGIRAKGIRTAVIGCGGAGQAVAAALKRAGSQVTLVNRSSDRAEMASIQLMLPYTLLADFRAVDFDMVINATHSGKVKDEIPFSPETMAAGSIVMDLAYREGNTMLVNRAKAHGQIVVDGREILVNQVRKQFRVMTGREMPIELAVALVKPQDTINISERINKVS